MDLGFQRRIVPEDRTHRGAEFSRSFRRERAPENIGDRVPDPVDEIFQYVLFAVVSELNHRCAAQQGVIHDRSERRVAGKGTGGFRPLVQDIFRKGLAVRGKVDDRHCHEPPPTFFLLSREHLPEEATQVVGGENLAGIGNILVMNCNVNEGRN